MNYKIRPYGLTLIELLIALAIIVMMVTIVYSTHFATSQSVQKCQEKLTQTQEARSLLGKMSRQLRCLYIPSYTDRVTSLPGDFIKNNEAPVDTPVCLTAATDDREGVILQILTTANLFFDRKMPCEIWHVQYKYLPDQQALFYCQQPLVSQPETVRDQKNWIPLTTNLRSIQMQFYDGEKWQSKWNPDNCRAPEAVRISITLHGEHTQASTFSTVTSVTGRRSILEKVNRS